MDSLSFSLPLDDGFGFSLSFRCFNREKSDFIVASVYRYTLLYLDCTCNVDNQASCCFFETSFTGMPYVDGAYRQMVRDAGAPILIGVISYSSQGRISWK